jgi:Putative beta-barrel porin-2, OmpL-like. bbp2/Carboxypeptidase regulatory-like domain
MKRDFSSTMPPPSLAHWVLVCLAFAGMVGSKPAVAQDSSAPAMSSEAQPLFGAIAGVVRSSARSPIAGAMVTIAKTDGKGIWTTISGNDGIYSIPNVAPGEYRLTSEAEGYSDAAALTIHVMAGRAIRTDIAMNAAASAPSAISSSDSSPPNPSTPATREPQPAPLSSRDLSATKPQAAEPVTVASLKVPPLIPSNPPATGAAAAASPALEAHTPSAPPADSGSAQAAGPAAPQAPGQTPPQASNPAGPASTAAHTGLISAAPAVDTKTPFADYDWTWLNGYPRNRDTAFDTPFFTPEIRTDVNYVYDFNRPQDNSMGGSSELFRSNEIQLTQLGVGGDFHWDNVRARLMTQFGEYSYATVRNDASYAKGQWQLDTAYRYLSEAYGGYHINKLDGINVDVGIFLSYIGLFSYYNFDNWAYQPSYVSSNTPWFFTGMRIQIFPTHHLKIEPWIINGWQSYASANYRKGLGGQIRYTPFSWLLIISNNYGLGHDDLYVPNRARIHTDNSIEIKYYDKPQKTLDKMAFSFTGDLGCEFGGGVSCYHNTAGGPKQSFIGAMLYNRFWFHKDMFGLTLGGGAINNPGRYLVLIPPINGETAASAALNSPYFTFNPGDPFKAWDSSVTFDYMPREWITFRFEGDYRHANVPYWSGPKGITPPPFLGGTPGTNNGFPTQFACMNGNASGQTVLSAATVSCASQGGVWFPDLRRNEVFVDFAILVKF